MRNKTFWVSFQDQPRVYRQEPPTQYPSLKNPDLSKVAGIPMHEWTIEAFNKRQVAPGRIRWVLLGVTIALLLGALLSHLNA